MEQILKTHRDEALKLLKENRAQTREGIELLVKGRLGAIAAAACPPGAPPSAADLEVLYREVVDLAYMMFSLGYTVAHTVETKEP
ncbi:MAG TPA: hypothetical protein VD902_09480 [Symbiobacteriaceae bacterium]|nr:hypothetical protein [Symbiobacteriaceae bacterium]